ncbi:hypothetical protein [Granulicella sp. S190]|uniref:hypothetical protein n=1 Tax=Granulicella sp. S190 TaxID=1747226 RepID=UPI001C2074B4|nr:hypothetical protein [Granulicella sp. S190]
MVGRKVVVTPTLTPSQPGTSYQLNWGDGSAIETVTGAGTHHYAKAKLYKVSARTKVENRVLNHEILLQVGPVLWPRIIISLAALSGLGFWLLHPVLKVTASYRWGAPGVPEMKLLSRKPYFSLSFEPGYGPAEERITFLKK